MKKTIFIYPLVCKGPSREDVGGARGAVFQEIRPEADFKTREFVQEKKMGGGATVERLLYVFIS